MYIKKLEVKNFRNHANTKLEFSKGVNILVGDNAQGKTNLLEAIYLTCVGRGWRTRKDKEMINFAAEHATVKTATAKNFGDINVEVNIPKQNKKTIKINNIPIQKMGELMGQVNCVFFSPDELRLIKEAPSDRRRFLDIDISQIDKTYFYSLLRYHKILAQRNALLKSGSNDDISSGLEIWDKELAKAGAYIIKKRIEFLELLKPITERIHSALASNKESIELTYEKSIESIDENSFLKALEKSKNNDLRLRTTTVGPHRDDIYISINTKDVRHFASQGQQRTVALSLKLAELELFKELTGETPILLLDDVLSELDDNRQAKLLEAIKNCQSIITATSLPKDFIDIKIFNIHNGELTK